MRQAVKSKVKRCTSAKVRRKKIHPRQMLEKSRNAVFLQWFVCQVSRKVGLLKRRVRRKLRRGDIKNCTPLWRKAHFEVKMLKNWRSRTTFWGSDVEKLHAAVAKSTFWSENVQNTSAPKHFLLFSRRKNARRCGEKHMWKWKCTKHEVFGALLYVQMSKNGTPLWRNANVDVKMLKTWGVWSTFWCFDVEKLHAVVAKRTFGSEIVRNMRCLEHICKWKCTKHEVFGALFELQMSENLSVSKFFSQSISQVVN